MKTITYIRLVKLRVFLYVCIIICPTNTWAVGALKPTEAELRMLPPYCKIYYKIALENIEYMEKNASKRFVLMPEIYYTNGKLLYAMGRTDDAVKYLTNAIRLKRNYVAPYVKLIDIYRSLGLKGKADKVLKVGLKYNPKSKTLSRRKTELK